MIPEINKIYCGDALEILRTWPDSFVQTVVTSPPYWGLRDYGTSSWEGGNRGCDHSRRTSDKTAAVSTESSPTNSNHEREGWKGGVCGKCGAHRIDRQIGLEKTPEEYVETMVPVFRYVRRVLRDNGTLWLNIGDSYCSGSMGGCDRNRAGSSKNMGQNSSDFHAAPNRMPLPGLKDKDLVGIPWMVAFALRADGWYLRSDIIWSKPNPMPESVTDRPTKAHEYLFLLTKSAKYFYDAEAIKEPAIYFDDRRARASADHKSAPTNMHNGIRENKSQIFTRDHPERAYDSKFAVYKDVRAYDGKHSDKQRGHGRRHAGFNARWDVMDKKDQCGAMRNKRSVWAVATHPYSEAHFATFPEKLINPCVLAGSRQGDIVLDPFMGAGTTALVSSRLNRNFIGIELNPKYVEMAKKRISPEMAQGKFA